jgi:hypothetical protein
MLNRQQSIFIIILHVPVWCSGLGGINAMGRSLGKPPGVVFSVMTASIVTMEIAQ